MEARGLVQSQVEPCVWYKEEMVLIFYFDDCLLFITSKDKIDEVYASIQEDLKIEYYVELNKYLGIEMDRRPDVSIHMRKPRQTQRIINIIPGMYKSIAKLTPEVKPPLAKNEGAQVRKNDFNYRSAIGSLNFLINSTRPEAQFMIRQCALFSADIKLLLNQAVKRILNYLKGTSYQGLIMKPDPKKFIE